MQRTKARLIGHARCRMPEAEAGEGLGPQSQKNPLTRPSGTLSHEGRGKDPITVMSDQVRGDGENFDLAGAALAIFYLGK